MPIDDLNANFIDDDKVNAKFNDDSQINAKFSDVIVVETGDYEKLINHPQINDEEVVGNKTFEQYGLRSITNLEIKEIFDRVFKGGE